MGQREPGRLLRAGQFLPELPGARDRDGQRVGDVPSPGTGVPRNLLPTEGGRGHQRGR